MRKKNWLLRILCGSLAALMLIGASIAYAQESDEIEDAAEQTTVEEIQEPVSKPENTDVSSGEADPEPDPEPEPEPEPDPDPIPDPEPEPETPTLALSVEARTTMTLKTGKTKTVYATVAPEGTEVTWESSNETVASVSVSDSTLQMTITAAKAGTAKITAEVDGASPLWFYVVVKDGKNPSPSPNPNPNNGAGNTVTPPTGLGTPSMSVSTATYKMPDNIPDHVSLTINSNLGTSTDTMLDALYSYDYFATFFVDPEKIYEKDNRVRRIVGQGHSVGIQLSAKQVQKSSTALAVLDDANADLSTVCGVPTRLVTVEGGSENLPNKVYKALKKAGYRIWDWDYTTGTTISDTKKAAEELEQKMDTKESVVVRMTSSKKAAEMLTETLGYMNYVQIPTRTLTSSDTPVCFAGK